jgi:hypothetical protein
MQSSRSDDSRSAFPSVLEIRVSDLQPIALPQPHQTRLTTSLFIATLIILTLEMSGLNKLAPSMDGKKYEFCCLVPRKFGLFSSLSYFTPSYSFP